MNYLGKKERERNFIDFLKFLNQNIIVLGYEI